MPYRFINRLPLRTRLTLWVVAVAVVMQGAMGVVFYLHQQDAVNRFFDRHLQLRTDSMVDSLRDLVPGVRMEELQAIADHETKNAMFAGFVLTVYNDQGEQVATTRQSPSKYPLTAAELKRIAREQTILFRRRPASEVKRFEPQATMARAVVRGFVGQDDKRYVLSAGTSDTYAEQMLNLVLRAVVAAFLPGLLVAGLSGWVIAGLAVRPIHEMSEAARQLGPESIDRAMPLTGHAPEIERLQHDLENARQRLSRAFAAQERFMSNVSHELKTPIAVMLTEAQTLNVRGCSKEVNEFVRSTSDELRRLGSMVDGFLLLTRVRDGQSLVRNAQYLVNELVMDSVSHCAPMASHYEVKLTQKLCETDVDLRVWGDPSLLRTMIDNLVRNAIRFSPKGQQIEISAQAAGNLAIVRVRDYGPGIPEAIIERVFDRFVQAPDEHRRGRGHGLGLEIAQGIAELHGGRIAVRNCRDDGEDGGGGNGSCAEGGNAGTGPIAGRGCEFEVRLPRFGVENEPEVQEGVNGAAAV